MHDLYEIGFDKQINKFLQEMNNSNIRMLSMAHDIHTKTH